MSLGTPAAFVLLLAIAANVHSSAIRQPPNPDQTALMARFVVNEANYTSIGTISIRNDTKNYPYVSLLSSSDGAVGSGSGVPYVFITPLDFPGQDLLVDQRVTLMMSLMQGSWCAYKNYDPMDPRCARVTFSGKMKKISKEDPEYATAKAAIFGRHPWLAHVPENHHFYFAKLEIETICVFAKFGGPQYVTPKDYYNASENDLDAYARRYR